MHEHKVYVYVLDQQHQLTQEQKDKAVSFFELIVPEAEHFPCGWDNATIPLDNGSVLKSPFALTAGFFGALTGLRWSKACLVAWDGIEFPSVEGPKNGKVPTKIPTKKKVSPFCCINLLVVSMRQLSGATGDWPATKRGCGPAPAARCAGAGVLCI